MDWCMATYNFRLTILCAIISLCAKTSTAQIITHLPVFKKCDEHQRLAIDLKSVRIARAASRDFINLTLTARMDLLEKEDHPYISINLEKCNSKEALDTCVHMLELKSSKICAIITKVTGIKQFLDCCTPPAGNCLVRKGTYVCKNCAIDLKKFHPMPLPEFYWKAVTKVYARNELVFCLYTEGYLERVRVRNT